MFREKSLLLFIILFYLIPFFSFAQGQQQSKSSSETTPESAIGVLTKEKEKALKTGEIEKARLIEERIENFKAGKITMSELLQPGGTPQGMSSGGDMSQNQNMMEGSQGMDGYSQGKAAGMSAGGKSLKELQKAKEAAIKSGDMEEAKRIHAEIESIRKTSKMSQDTSSKQSSMQQERHQQGGPPSGSGSGPTPEFMINILEKEKEKALQSGNMWAAEAIDAQIKDFKAGKTSMDELMKQKPKE